MKHHRVANEARCPSCGMVANGATHPYDNDAHPTGGDLSICVNCCAVLAFTDDLAVRLVDADELHGLPFVIRLQLESLRGIIARESSRASRKH